MADTIYGTGRKRRNDVLHRVMDTIFKGQGIPLGGNANPEIMQKLMSSTSISSATVIDMANPDSSSHFITCNVSKANGSDVCA